MDSQQAPVTPRTAAARAKRLVLKSDEGVRVPLAHERRFVVGAAPDADLTIRGPGVAEHHLEILRTDRRVVLRDLAGCGTLVDGVLVLEAFLAPGNVISVGGHSLRISSEAKDAGARTRSFGRLTGVAASTQRTIEKLERAAETSATVLLTGETGTGKEEAARALHTASDRRDGPFVVVDCGALSHELAASELFGHVKGSFTDAIADRAGAFETARGGSVFLDEIGEVPLELQPRLLRVLEAREVRRVGSNAARPIDVRIIAATHRDLEAHIEAKTFRADLFYRLAVVRIELPPLRARVDDIPLLVEQLARRFGPTPSQLASLMSAPTLATIQKRSWPGNVRQLANFIELSLAFGELAD